MKTLWGRLGEEFQVRKTQEPRFSMKTSKAHFRAPKFLSLGFELNKRELLRYHKVTFCQVQVRFLLKILSKDFCSTFSCDLYLAQEKKNVCWQLKEIDYRYSIHG